MYYRIYACSNCKTVDGVEYQRRLEGNFCSYCGSKEVYMHIADHTRTERTLEKKFLGIFPIYKYKSIFYDGEISYMHPGLFYGSLKPNV